jgi:hypothetical protein
MEELKKKLIETGEILSLNREGIYLLTRNLLSLKYTTHYYLRNINIELFYKMIHHLYSIYIWIILDEYPQTLESLIEFRIYKGLTSIIS